MSQSSNALHKSGVDKIDNASDLNEKLVPFLQQTDQKPEAFYLAHITFSRTGEPDAIIEELRSINLHVAASIALICFGMCSEESNIPLRIFPDEEDPVKTLLDKYASGYEYWIGKGEFKRTFLKKCSCKQIDRTCMMSLENHTLEK
jgi:hypothetical protein